MLQTFRSGDLCVPHNPLPTGFVIVSRDERLLNALCEIRVEDMVMVTRRGPVSAAARSSMSLIRGSLGISSDAGRDQVLEVLIASGPRAGALGYLPSFWLRVVIPAPR